MTLIKSVLTFKNVELWFPEGECFSVSGELVKVEDTDNDYIHGYEWQELSVQCIDEKLVSHDIPEAFFSLLVPGTANRGGYSTKEMSLRDFIQDELIYLEAEGKLPTTWEEVA